MAKVKHEARCECGLFLFILFTNRAQSLMRCDVCVCARNSRCLSLRLANARKDFQKCEKLIRNFITSTGDSLQSCDFIFSFLFIFARAILLICSDVCVVYRSLVTHTSPLIQNDRMQPQGYNDNSASFHTLRRRLVAISLMHWLQREWRAGSSWTNENFSKLRFSHKYQNTKCSQWAIHAAKANSMTARDEIDGAEKEKKEKCEEKKIKRAEGKLLQLIWIDAQISAAASSSPSQRPGLAKIQKRISYRPTPVFSLSPQPRGIMCFFCCCFRWRCAAVSHWMCC